MPPLVEADPGAMSEDDRSRLGVHRLPQTLPDALVALTEDETVSGWFTDAFLKTYRGIKRKEIALLEGLDTAAVLARYSDVY